MSEPRQQPWCWECGWTGGIHAPYCSRPPVRQPASEPASEQALDVIAEALDLLYHGNTDPVRGRSMVHDDGRKALEVIRAALAAARAEAGT